MNIILTTQQHSKDVILMFDASVILIS